MGLFDLFTKKRTMLDEIQDITIRGFRGLAKANNTPPTSKTTDEDILRINAEIINAYRAVEAQRNEVIPAKSLFAISFHFMQVSEMKGQKFYEEHLEYEIAKYLEEGLRDYQKKGIELF
jgi:hypothetical protein